MKRIPYLFSLIMVLAILITACGSNAASQATQPAAQATEMTTTEAPPATEAPPSGPQVGGTLVIATGLEVDTLDVHKTSQADLVMRYVGASLLSVDPATGEFVPYLAEKWSVSEDGLTYEFKLREDVKFHDGTPLKAEDYVWTFTRALTQEIPSTATGSLQGVIGAELVDEYTFRLKLGMPNSALLNTLALATYHQPLSKAYIEKLGDEYGRNPMGVGPFVFKTWETGEKIVLERNPDFVWGPSYTHGGPAYIQTIEFRFIPEYATQLAGLEAGEVDYMTLASKDVEKVKNKGVTIFETYEKGSGTTLFMNTSRAPFNDVNVRKAVNQLINREQLVKVILDGNGSPSFGPLTPATIGYWSGVEAIGYPFDLEAAKNSLISAGYSLNANNVFEKDGQPLALKLTSFPDQVKLAEVLQQQFQAAGIEVTIEQGDPGVNMGKLTTGDYDMALASAGWPDYGILFALYHPATLGAFNWGQVNDPQLSPILEMMAGAPVQQVVQDAANNAQKYIVEQALVAPLYAAKSFFGMHGRVVDALFTDRDQLYLFDAYIQP